MSPEVLDTLLSKSATSNQENIAHGRLLAGRAKNEDACVLSIPAGKAIVQSVDVLSPIVNNPYIFGRIVAANALSDIYAMGGEPWSALNIACFPHCNIDDDTFNAYCAILQGGSDALAEAGAYVAGGHTVIDSEIKYGMSVTGIIDPNIIATNDALVHGDILLLTKPLGIGILAMTVKACWEKWEENECILEKWCAKLNNNGAKVIQKLKLKAATDVTGFGLGGHLLEMANASSVCIQIQTESLPLLHGILDYARNGFIPAASHNNKKYHLNNYIVKGNLEQALESIIFDVQTSGGLVLAVPPDKVTQAIEILKQNGDECWIIGNVTEKTCASTYMELLA